MGYLECGKLHYQSGDMREANYAFEKAINYNVLNTSIDIMQVFAKVLVFEKKYDVLKQFYPKEEMPK